MDEISDLQAQTIALRLAVEGVWLSLLRSDPNAVAEVERLRRENVAAVAQLPVPTAAAGAVRDAVARHTDQLWGSIAWQLEHPER